MSVERAGLAIIGFNSRPFLDIGLRTPIVHSPEGDFCFQVSSTPDPIPRLVYDQLLENGQVTGLGVAIPVSPDRLVGEASPVVGYLSRYYKGLLATLSDPEIQVKSGAITTFVYANREPATVNLIPLVKMEGNVEFWTQPLREAVPMLLVWGRKLREQFDRSWASKTLWQPNLVRPLNLLDKDNTTEIGYWESFVTGIRNIATATGNRDLRYECAIREYDVLDYFPEDRSEKLKAHWLRVWRGQFKDFDDEKFYRDLEEYKKFLNKGMGLEPI